MTDESKHESSESKQVITKNTVQNELVEKAYQNLSQIFSGHLENAMMDAGSYLIKEFYDNNIELAKAKKSPKNESLNQLIKRLQNRSSDSPSKSWIYQSIGLIIQSHDIEKQDKKFFQTFGKLSLSHKLSLLSVSNLSAKKELIQKIIQKNLSVRELEKLKEKLKISSGRKISLLSLLNNPEKITSKDNIDLINLDSLKKEPLKKLKKFKEKTAQKRKEFKNRLKEFQNKIKKHETYIEQYSKLISDINEALKTKKPDTGRGRPPKES